LFSKNHSIVFNRGQTKDIHHSNDWVSGVKITLQNAYINLLTSENFQFSMQSIQYFKYPSQLSITKEGVQSKMACFIFGYFSTKLLFILANHVPKFKNAHWSVN
jgi:hypothetical protein